MSETERRLPGWIHDVDLEPASTRLEAIQGAAAKLAKSTTEEQILDLVLLAHGTSRDAAFESVAAALRTHDEESAVREGDLLAALTAAAACAFALEAESKIAVPFGLAVRSASFLGYTPAVPELDALAQAGLARASEAQRRRAKLAATKPDIDTALAGWSELEEGLPVQTETLNTARTAVDKAAKAAAAVAPRALPPIGRRFEALEEEVDLLWWALGEFSEIADKPFKSLPEQAAGCVAGVELASLTARRAPLPATRALFSRLLQTPAEKPTDLGRALPAAVKEMGDQWVDDHPDGHPLLPVLSSLEEYRTLGTKAVWKDTIEARWHVDPTRATTVLDLAEQVIREILLARTTAE